MKNNRWIILGILAFLIVTGVSYKWATGLMDSLYAYRSPFASAPLPAGSPTGTAITRRVVAILVDGLRVDTAANQQVMPYLNQLREAGASATIHSSTPSYSFPGWSVLMIGAWPDLSDGPAMNPTEGISAETWTQDNVFSSVHRAGLKTAFAGTDFFTQVIPPAALDASFLVHEETEAADQQSADEAVKMIQNGDFSFLLVHINQVDHAGHEEGGPRDPRWNQTAAHVDQQLEQIISALDLTRDTVLIFSDHGHIDAGGHGGQDPVVLIQPFIMAGAGVRPGAYPDIDQVDVAPTITTLLGANIPAVTQGQVLTEMLSLSDAQLSAITRASIEQQKTLYEAYAKAMSTEPVTVEVDPAHYPVTIFRSAMTSIRNSRLNQERLPRFLLAGILALVPAFFLLKNRGKSVAWYLLGSAIYLAVFHLQYGLLQGRTYSLSSVLSSGDIINTTAIDTALAFGAAWLIVLIALRLFSVKPTQAAHQHLAFAFTTLYIVSLPALWSFAFNGALVTWTLPDMASMFMAFLSILQLLIIAALGLILTALTPLISLVFQKR